MRNGSPICEVEQVATFCSLLYRAPPHRTISTRRRSMYRSMYRRQMDRLAYRNAWFLETSGCSAAVATGVGPKVELVVGRQEARLELDTTDGSDG
ncbi:unnamed protein product, partial [Protopolystoma xenopodis]